MIEQTQYPEIILIPHEYANKASSKFVLYNKKGEKQQNAQVNNDFFLIWVPNSNLIETLEASILKFMPQIPLKKAFTCEIEIIDSLNDLILKGIGKIVPIEISPRILLETGIKDNVTSNSIYFWGNVLKLSLQVINEGNFIPHSERIDESDKIKIMWKPLLRSFEDFENYKNLLSLIPNLRYQIPQFNKIDQLQKYFSRIINVILRNALKKTQFAFFENVYGFSPRDSSKLKNKIPWEIRLLSSLILKDELFEVNSVLENLIPDIILKWEEKVSQSLWKLGYSLMMELKLPKSEKIKWKLNFYLQSLADSNIKILLTDLWSKFNYYAGKIVNLVEVRRKILSLLISAGKIFQPIKRALNKSNPTNISLSIIEASNFIKWASRTLKSKGFSVQIPKVFERSGNQRISVVMKVKQQKDKPVGKLSDIKDISFDMNSILSYEWEFNLGDKKIEESEINKLKDSKEPLMYLNGKWILLDADELIPVKDILQGGTRGQITARSALSHKLINRVYYVSQEREASPSLYHPPKNEKETIGPFEIKLEGEIKDIFDTLTGKKKPKKLKQPDELNGILRPYQLAGFNWIVKMTDLGFNVCLADDMGLGKTIQVISFIIELRKRQKNLKCLVISPTSVLSNWKRELEKFAPDIQKDYYYGPSRPTEFLDLLNLINKNDVILSTYGLLRRDIKNLSLIDWDVVILDESQNIKNYKSQQTKASYSIKSKTKICLTGTPIENHLVELWSAYHFLNPFLLGKRSEFVKKYYIQVERFGNKELSEELRKFISPFLLRRLKSDKKIIKDLPDKQEIKVFIDLTQEQKINYKLAVEEGMEAIERNKETKGKFKRSGAILNTILKLKQICNYPDLSKKKLKISAEKIIMKSGKMQRLMEILEEIIESGNKILIFSQFTSLLEILEKIIQEKFNINPLYLHGRLSQKNREKAVELFQNDRQNKNPIFLLSLKAGGTGLNLTAASFVLHFDRWWNPSVENQATDRAYRIGQKKNVMVYKFLCSGTIEEKIDKMIESKREMAENIIASSGEQWITDFSNSDLEKLFQLEEIQGGM